MHKWFIFFVFATMCSTSCVYDEYCLRMISSEKNAIKVSMVLPKNMEVVENYPFFIGKDDENGVNVLFLLDCGKSSNVTQSDFEMYTKNILDDLAKKNFKIIGNNSFERDNWNGQKIELINTNNNDYMLTLVVRDKYYLLSLVITSNARKKNEKVFNKILPSLAILSPCIEVSDKNKFLVFCINRDLWKMQIPFSANFAIKENHVTLYLSPRNSIIIAFKKEIDHIDAIKRYQSVTQKLSKSLSSIDILSSSRIDWTISSYVGKNKKDYELFSVACHRNYVVLLSYSSESNISSSEKELCNMILQSLSILPPQSAKEK